MHQYCLKPPFFAAKLINKAMEKMKKTYCVAMVFVSLLMAGCHSGQEKQNTTADSQVKVKTMQVSASAAGNGKHYSGTVEESNETALSFPVMGTVREIQVHPGERVSRGQLIATIDPASMQSAYEAARAALDQAEDAYQRMKELYDKGSLAEIKWIEVQSKLQQAKAMEEISKKNLDDTKLLAPYGGVISEKLVEVGQNVAPGIPVARLVAVNQLKVKISVPESEIAQITLKTPVRVQVPAMDEQWMEGTVCEKGIVANSLSRSYEVKIALADSRSGNLMPGMVADVVMDDAAAARTFVIPAYIVQLDEHNNTFVWLCKDGKARKQVVTVGNYMPDGVIILTGLNEGDEIITEGRQKVCEGTPVACI